MIPSSDRNVVWIGRVLESIAAIGRYTAGMSEEDFLSSDITRDACLLHLIVIGEFAGRVSADIQAQNAQIAWREMRDARNYFAHEYDGVDWIQVWETISKELSQLHTDLNRILDRSTQDH